MDIKRIEKMLSDLYYEFIAYPAWSAHAFAFEYMNGFDNSYYQQILDIMKENNISTDDLVSAYNKTVTEYNRIADSDELSFLSSEDTKHLDMLDNSFLLMMYDAGELISDLIGVDVGFKDCSD